MAVGGHVEDDEASPKILESPTLKQKLKGFKRILLREAK
jgi:hypothetical protein